MTHNLNCTVFVYRQRETGAIRALYTEDARAMTGRDDYEHVGSLEPRMWIEHHFDAAVKERQPLTDDEVSELSRSMVKGNKSVNWLCRAVESPHGIGVEHDAR